MSKKDLWIDCGYAILTSEGHESITIDELSKRMGISRGSFFYHFKNRDGFIQAMMERWRSATEDVINSLDDSGSFDACYDMVTRKVSLLSVDHEQKIRIWGGTQPIVAETIHAVDALRMTSFIKIFSKLGLPEDTTASLARFRYGLLLGLKQLDTEISADEIVRSADLFKQMVLLYRDAQ